MAAEVRIAFPRMTNPRLDSRTTSRAARLVVAIAALLPAACGSTGRTTPRTEPGAGIATAPAARPGDVARIDSLRASYTDADVAFMAGMIHHHAQALVMSAMAPSHGASDRLLVLTSRIHNSQQEEIHRMQAWLRDRGEHVPEVNPDGTMAMHGMAPMPGMLTDAQMAELDASRGPDFDRAFLVYMIQHHKGALTMVDDLFATNGAGQGEAVFKLASDIGADQKSEIERMQKMLAALATEGADQP